MKFRLYIPLIWQKSRNLWAFICCLLLLLGCQSGSEAKGSMVKVKQVVSGQSFQVLDSDNTSESFQRIRLIGIEAPDIKQLPWGLDAQNRLEQLIGGKSVLLEFDQQLKDQFQRRLAYVWYNLPPDNHRPRQLLNEQLLKEGYALFIPRSPNHKYDQRLAKAQEFARIMGVGIWNPKQPMRLTPAEFRRQYR